MEVETLKTYFDSDKHSDVTIHLKNGSIKAHKLVLAQGSDYFKACFEGNFEEAKSSTLVLKDDDPSALQCLFKFFYGFQYDPANTIASTTAGANSMRHYKTYLGRYVVAQKYLVPKLCSQAKETFKCQLADSKTHCPEASVFPDLVRLIYITYADEAIDFRELLVNHFVQWTSKTQKNTEFRALFKEVTDFAFDVVDAAMRQNDNAAPAEAPPDKKRKV